MLKRFHSGQNIQRMMRCRWLCGDVSVGWRSCVDAGMRWLVYGCMWGCRFVDGSVGETCGGLEMCRWR
jgi:hypothetical protein